MHLLTNITKLLMSLVILCTMLKMYIICITFQFKKNKKNGILFEINNNK